MVVKMYYGCFSGIHPQNPTGKNYGCEYIFCEEKQKVGLFVYHLEGLRVPLMVRVPQFGNHCSTCCLVIRLGEMYSSKQIFSPWCGLFSPWLLVSIYPVS